MLTSVRYFDLVREMKNPYNHRLRLVESAKQRGIKPTARLFATTVLVITSLRKLLRLPKRNLSNSAKLFPPSALAASSANSICPSAIVLSSVSGGSMAC